MHSTLTDEKRAVYGSVNSSESRKGGSVSPRKMICVSILIVILVGGAACVGAFEKRMHQPHKPSIPLPKELADIPPLPGYNSLGQVYNLFRGTFLSNALSHSMGHFSFSTDPYRNSVTLRQTTYRFPLGVEVIPNVTCVGKQQKLTVMQTSRVSEMTATSSDLSYGYDSTTTVDVSVPVGDATIGASRDIRTALLFGNSKSVSNSRTRAQQGYTHEMTGFEEAVAYDLRVNWASPALNFQYDQTFLDALKATASISEGNAARNKKAFAFFEAYGSHVVSRAQFGGRCSRNMYFKAGYSSDSTRRVEETVKSKQLDLYGIQWGSSSTEYTEKNEQFSNGMEYSQMSTVCSGTVSPNDCNPQGISAFDPVILRAEPLPVWELSELISDTRGRSVGSSLKESARDLVRAAEKCAQTRCTNGNGVCRLNQNFWSLVNGGSWSGYFSDSNFDAQCICKNGYGANCNAPPPCQECGECIADGTSRMLNGFHDRWGLMSIDKCLQECAGMGFSKAGVQAGYECWCGSAFTRAKQPTDRCTLRCGGDSSQFCGGNYALNVYDAKILVPRVQVYGSGCYRDNANRILYDNYRYDKQMTVNYCRDFCIGYTYFGVEGFYECFCGNSFRSALMYSTGCTANCGGDNKQICGGNWLINVFTHA